MGLATIYRMLGRLVFLCVFVAVGTETDCNTWYQPFLIGGREAHHGQFPYQVSIQYEEQMENAHMCGGAILTSRMIISSAQCIDMYHDRNKNKEVVVRAGMIDLRKKKVPDAQTARIQKTYRHKKFEKGKAGPHDLGIFVLERYLKLNHEVAPVVLPKAGEIPAGHAILSGWPYSDNRNYILNFAEFPLISYETCKDFYADDSGPTTVEDTNFCAGPIGAVGKAACSGDSGGPLVQRNKDGEFELIGIESWNRYPCSVERDAPVVFTRVSAYVGMIDAAIEAESPAFQMYWYY